MDKPFKINVAMVDDHQIVLAGYSALLKGMENIQIVYATTSPLDLLKALPTLNVHVLITDCMMPEMNGLELSIEVKRLYPEIKILALSMSGSGDFVDEMLNKADISGYLLKNISKNELVEAIEKVAAGGNYFGEEVLDELSKVNFIKKENQEAHLTTRETEIVKLIEKENNNKQIAEKLFISERTVETHRKNIYRKTNTNTILGLIKYAYQHGLID